MAIPVNLTDLINSRVIESTRIEFKADFNPDPVVRTICAFANDIDNTGGGYIILGVEENNGTPVLPPKGIDPARVDGILKKLREYCHFIEPLYQPVVEAAAVGERTIIVIWVAGGFGRPYKAPKEVTSRQSEKRYYIRKFSATCAASPEEEKELFYISSSIPFDDRPCLAAEVSDLDAGLMRAHLKAAGSSMYERSLKEDAKSIAADLQLLDGPEECLKPRNAGILLFSERPEKFFRYARIEVVDIPDPTGTNMVEKCFTGPIQRQLSDALLYLRNYVLKEAVIKHPDRADAQRISNYPYAAVEEILANAVYHRSYQVNEPVTVRITGDAMEITSFPGFDRSITDAAIDQKTIRARACRNRRIGDFLKELHLIEGRNTGFPNARNALVANGSPDLVFEMDPERSYLSVTIPVHPYFLPKGGKDAEYEKKILDILGCSPCSLTELAKAMGYKGITAKLRNTVNVLQNRGTVVQIVWNAELRYARKNR